MKLIRQLNDLMIFLVESAVNSLSWLHYNMSGELIDNSVDALEALRNRFFLLARKCLKNGETTENI